MAPVNREARLLSKKFGLRVNRIQTIQAGVYRIRTRGGKTYCLKSMPYAPARIRWIDTTLARMRKQNKRLHFGWPSSNRKSRNKLYVRLPRHDAPPFMLIPWIHGSWPASSSRSQMKASGALLAQFHQTGRRIKIPVKGQYRAVGSWTAYFQKEQRALQKAIRKAQRNEFRSPLDPLLKKHGQEILRRSRQSLQMLRKSGYRRACRTKRLTLCHGDFGPTNLIRTPNGMAIIDFETLRIDLHVYDLYKAIFNFCQSNDWQFKTAKAFLDGYQQSGSRIRQSDYRLLKALLRFPRGISKHIQHYRDKSPKIKREIEHDFPKIMAYERKRAHFLRKLDRYANSINK